MTILEIKSKIVEWIKTGIPQNVKSSNMRTLLSKLAIRVDVQEVGRLKVLKATGNASESQEVGDKVTGIVQDTLIINAIYLGGNVNLLASYTINNPLTLEDLSSLLVKSESFVYTDPINTFMVSSETITTLIDVQIDHGCNFNDIATIDNDNEVTIASEGVLFGGEKIRIIYI